MNRQESPWASAFTPVDLESPPFCWGTNERFLLLGSCFTSHLTTCLSDHFLDAAPNPFGQLYHPFSLAQALETLKDPQGPDEGAIFFHKGLWRHPLFHTSWAHPDRDVLTENLRRQHARGRLALQNCGVLILTFGTAWYHQNNADCQIWANCHTLDKKDFTRDLSDFTNMRSRIAPVLDQIQADNPRLKIVLTLSPVRHLSGGAQQNSLSKSHLRILIDQLVREAPHSRDYFPASEILLDELRDYRWYEIDRVHPSAEAAEAITHRFLRHYADPRLLQFMPQAQSLRRDYGHRLQHPDSDSGRQWLQNLAQKTAQLSVQYPEVLKLSELAAAPFVTPGPDVLA